MTPAGAGETLTTDAGGQVGARRVDLGDGVNQSAGAVVQGSRTTPALMLRLLALGCLVALAPALAAQSLPAEARAYLGDWTTYNDEGTEAQAVVRITAPGGVLRGRIVRVLPTEEYPVPQFRCDDCAGQYAGTDLRTVPLIEGMEWTGDEFSGGRVTDPTKDKRYRGVLKLDGSDRLRVRGFIGIRALGRTQVWRRAR